MVERQVDAGMPVPVYLDEVNGLPRSLGLGAFRLQEDRAQEAALGVERVRGDAVLDHAASPSGVALSITARMRAARSSGTGRRPLSICHRTPGDTPMAAATSY